jgi:hypothetical protein
MFGFLLWTGICLEMAILMLHWKGQCTNFMVANPALVSWSLVSSPQHLF